MFRFLLFISALSLCQLSAQVSYTPRQLDSLRAAMVSTNISFNSAGIDNRVVALIELLHYFGRQGKGDTVARHCQVFRAKTHPIPPFDSLYAESKMNDVMGKCAGFQGDHQTELQYYFKAKENAQAILQLQEPDINRRNKANTTLNLIYNNIAVVCIDLKEFDRADSLLALARNHLIQTKDTVYLILNLRNQSVLYRRMTYEKRKESADITAQLRANTRQVQDSAIRLARAYVSHNPDHRQARLELMALLNNKAMDMTNEKESNTYSTQDKSDLLSLIMEGHRIARDYGYPGRDMLMAKRSIVMLLLALNRDDKARETINELIAEAQKLNMPLIEADGYVFSYAYNFTHHEYPLAFADMDKALSIFEATANYSLAEYNLDDVLLDIRALPLLKRHSLRKQRTTYEQQAALFREKAAAAGQEKIE